VDFIDRDRGAEPALLTGIRQRARYRLQETDFHRAALSANNRRHSERAARGRGNGERGCLQKFTATESIVTVRHGVPPLAQMNGMLTDDLDFLGGLRSANGSADQLFFLAPPERTKSNSKP